MTDTDTTLMLTDNERDDFTSAYIACIAWSTLVYVTEGEEPESTNDYMVREDVAWSDEALAGMRAECEDFIRANGPELWYALARGYWTAEGAGHDFALTRQGHGAGFWDRYWDGGEADKLGKDLSTMSKVYGDVDVWVRVDEAGAPMSVEYMG